MATEDEQSKALAGARERRVELKTALSDAERAAAAPTAMANWSEHMLASLLVLRSALDQHIEEVEGPDGLLAELRELAPRLINKIDRVANEHPQLCRSLDDAITLTDAETASDEVRQAVVEVLFAIVRHRQHGSDLVFEGYNVDIGGG